MTIVTSDVKEAARVLLNDEVVAFPTETVYGLGGRATSDLAVRRIFEAKGRPADNPLIAHFASISQLAAFADIPAVYNPLLEACWPGALSILLPLPLNSPLSKLLTAGNPTFVARMPSNVIAMELLTLTGPLAGPSANTSGRPSPTTPAHVMYDLQGKIPLILDGGACDVGVESTVVDGLVSPPAVLRPGGVTLESIRQIPGWEKTVLYCPDLDPSEEKAVPTPGMKYTHYAPSAKLVLCRGEPVGVEQSMDKGQVGVMRTRHWKEIHGTVDRFLGSNSTEISRALFATLRELDELKCDVIYVEAVPDTDLGLAIMNRLQKAASVVQ